jgi:hypothetical protein
MKMTVNELRNFLKKLDGELAIYVIDSSESPLNEGRGVNRLAVVSVDSDEIAEAVYLVAD